MKKFFEFEKLPKMRGCEYNHDNEVQLFHKRHYMLLYIAKDENDPNIKEF